MRTEFLDANGMTFETDVYEGGDRLALMLHGFPETKRSWRHQIDTLTQRGFTVWAPNLRGYGRSSTPRGVNAYRLDHLIADVAGLIALGKERGLRDALVVSHDWGGMIGWASVLSDLPIAQFVVINLPHPQIFKRRLYRPSQLKKSWYMFYFQVPFLPERKLAQPGVVKNIFLSTSQDPRCFDEETLAEFEANAQRPGGATAMLNYYRAALRNQRILEMRDAPLEIPTLMIWGDEDEALGVELVEGTEKLVRDFTLRRLPGVSHWAQQEAPEKVNAVLGAWLDDEVVPSYGVSFGRLS